MIFPYVFIFFLVMTIVGAYLVEYKKRKEWEEKYLDFNYKQKTTLPDVELAVATFLQNDYVLNKLRKQDDDEFFHTYKCVENALLSLQYLRGVKHPNTFDYIPKIKSRLEKLRRDGCIPKKEN